MLQSSEGGRPIRNFKRSNSNATYRNRPMTTVPSTRSTARSTALLAALLAVIAKFATGLSALPLGMASAYAAAPAMVQLGAAMTYSVLGGTAAANTGTTTNLGGDLGVTPTGTITGYGSPNVVQGSTHLNDEHSAAARAALLAAYNDAAGRAQTGTIAGDQIGVTYTAGVYSSGAAAVSLSGGTMTLDGLSDPNAVFIFQIGGALSTAASSQISLINGAKASNVFWQVAGAVSTAAMSSFSGVIMGNAAVSMAAGATLNGALLTLNGAASTDDSTITTPVVNTTAPTVAITGGTSAATNDTTPTISGTTDAAIGTTVTVTVVGQTLTTTVAADGTWSVTANTLGEGTHTVSVSIRDTSGNTGTATGSQTLTVTPAINTTPAQTVMPGADILVTGAHFQPFGVVQVWFFSTPVQLGTLTVGPSGVIAGIFAAPDNAPTGIHRIVLIRPSGLQLYSQPITVPATLAQTGLAQTGIDISAAWLGLGFLLVGALAITITTHSRRKTIARAK
jgi:hypothetical protein